MEMYSRGCPVCGYHQFTKLFTTKDFFVTGKEFPVVACMQCGMRHTSHLPRENEMGEYYRSEAYISHSDTRKGFINSIYHNIRAIMLARKYKVVQGVSDKRTGTLLDIGTGTGYFASYMQKKGWQVTGSEQSSEVREFVKKEWNLEILSDEELFSCQSDSFDVITLWHVMEHIRNINQYWQLISRLLKPEGVLIIALPNARSADALHYKKFWAAWDVPRHVWHFTPEHIHALGKKEGFMLTNTYRMPFDSFYISMMSEKYKGSKFPLVKGLFHGKLSWISSLFRKNKSSSLIYVFHRKS